MRQFKKKTVKLTGSLSTLDDCKGYEFRITPKPAGFDESRVMCLQMGGDLIMHNLGPEGGQYHEYNFF